MLSTNNIWKTFLAETSVAGLKNALFAQSLFDQRKTNLPESVFGISHRQNVVDKRLLSSQNNTKLQ